MLTGPTPTGVPVNSKSPIFKVMKRRTHKQWFIYPEQHVPLYDRVAPPYHQSSDEVQILHVSTRLLQRDEGADGCQLSKPLQSSTDYRLQWNTLQVTRSEINAYRHCIIIAGAQSGVQCSCPADRYAQLLPSHNAPRWKSRG